ncbi:MAG: helix-turn-helix domain-containing protein [Cyclobacteriaceae bacterium]
MNPAFPDQFYNGILVCICIQLILIGVYKINLWERRSALLGAFCIIIGTLFIYNLFWVFFRESAFYSILLANHKNIYLAPLLYLYLVMLKPDFKHHTLVKHLMVPTIIFIGYSLLKHGFEEVFFENYSQTIVVVEALQFLVITYYFITGQKQLSSLKSLLKPAAYKRYLLFYNGFLIYLISAPFISLSTSLFSINEIAENYLAISRFLYMPMAIIIYSIIFLFVLIESNELKSLFLGEKLRLSEETIETKPLIKDKLQTYLLDQKLFKKHNLGIQELAARVGIKDKVLGEYFLHEHRTNFQNFLNILRVEEFKELSRNPDYSNLSIYGIANESGFKSKATFYRAFKKKEGITPNEYLKSI